MKIKKELIIHPKYPPLEYPSINTIFIRVNNNKYFLLPYKTIKGKTVYRKQEDGTYKWQWKNIYRKESKINENE